MGTLNAIHAWQFRDGHYIWEKNAIATLWPYSTLYVGTLNAIHAWQFRDEHYIWEKNAIATLWP